MFPTYDFSTPKHKRCEIDIRHVSWRNGYILNCEKMVVNWNSLLFWERYGDNWSDLTPWPFKPNDKTISTTFPPVVSFVFAVRRRSQPSSVARWLPTCFAGRFLGAPGVHKHNAQSENWHRPGIALSTAFPHGTSYAQSGTGTQQVWGCVGTEGSSISAVAQETHCSSPLQALSVPRYTIYVCDIFSEIVEK